MSSAPIIAWQRSVTVTDSKNVQHTTEDYGVDETDISYRDLIGDGLAKVNASFKFGTNFGKVQASVSATISCDQDATTMSIATRLLQRHVIGLTEEGMDMAVELYARKYGTIE